MKTLAVKQRGGGGPRIDIEAAGMDEARGLLNEDSERDNNSHSSKELKIRSSAALFVKNLIFLVATTALIFFGGSVVLRQRQGGASSFLGTSKSPPPSKGESSSADTTPGSSSSSQQQSPDNNSNLLKQMIPPAGAAVASAIRKTLQVTTWNIAAINNNPFEYWITYPDEPAYERLMVKMEDWIENPGTRDVKVAEGGVFTQQMFDKLDARLTGTAGWSSMKTYWENDYANRSIVSQFLKDGSLGAKRLASMPDRVTNIINTADGNSVYRPSVISMYDGDLSSQDKWWQVWETFMFDTKLDIKDPTSGAVAPTIPYQMLQKISKSKYPKISEAEEADSLPLQTLCGAIFDAILVYMMNALSAADDNNNNNNGGWQSLKRTMVENLNRKKVPHTLDILQNAIYRQSDIITLQEVSSAFVTMARTTPALHERFRIVTGADADPVRDQNSVIFLNKNYFDVAHVEEITATVKSHLPSGVTTGNGDILCLAVSSADGKDKFVICSFHGDTDGLQTIPVTDAVAATVTSASSPYRDHHLIFGLDANTYETVEKPGEKQPVMEYAQHFASLGLTSCWGEPYSNPSNYTTYNARTYLQTQLNKASKSTEKRAKGDVNPKDFILFRKTDPLVIRETWKDNTGHKSYTEDMAFPTLDFPSDHGLLATVLEFKE